METWAGGELVGGLYGVALNGAFFGESMFSTARDASKVALVYLCARLIHGGFSLLDTQFVTEHLKQFGTVEIDRAEFHTLLEKALAHDADFQRAARPTRSPQHVLDIIEQSAATLCPPAGRACEDPLSAARGGGAAHRLGLALALALGRRARAACRPAAGAGAVARGCAQSVSQTSNTGCSTALRPGLSANIQPEKMRFSLPSSSVSSTSTKVVVLGGSVGARV